MCRWTRRATGAILVLHFPKNGNSPTLGQDLSKSNLCTMLRVSMVAANLSTNRVVDGVSKLITKTDVASLKAKKFQEKLLQVEQFLAELWGMSQQSESARTIRYKSFGKAAIRTIFALPAKEKLGREPNHQYSHQQIRDAMLKDLQQHPNYIPRPKINDEPKGPASKSCGTLVKLDQSKDAMFVASQSLAIQVGSTYTRKGFLPRYGNLWNPTMKVSSLRTSLYSSPSKPLLSKPMKFKHQ